MIQERFPQSDKSTHFSGEDVPDTPKVAMGGNDRIRDGLIKKLCIFSIGMVKLEIQKIVHP